MIRFFTVAVAAICIGLGVSLLPALSQASRKAQRPNVALNTELSGETLTIRQMLQTPINVKPLQEKLKLKQALEFFSDAFKGKLVIIVDKEAFAAILGPDAPVDLYEEEVELPPVGDTMLMSTALRLVLSQPGKTDAAYVIRGSYIEILPPEYTKARYFLNEPIQVSFKKHPLREVLDELSDMTGLTINIDGRVGEKAGAAVTASFRGASLEEVLVTVTESADLKFVVLNKSIFVTTPNHVKAIEEEEKKRDEKRRENIPAGIVKSLQQ
jgi:hypothetical protein